MKEKFIPLLPIVTKMPNTYGRRNFYLLGYSPHRICDLIVIGNAQIVGSIENIRRRMSVIPTVIGLRDGPGVELFIQAQPNYENPWYNQYILIQGEE